MTPASRHAGSSRMPSRRTVPVFRPATTTGAGGAVAGAAPERAAGKASPRNRKVALRLEGGINSFPPIRSSLRPRLPARFPRSQKLVARLPGGKAILRGEDPADGPGDPAQFHEAGEVPVRVVFVGRTVVPVLVIVLPLPLPPLRVLSLEGVPLVDGD